MENLEQGPVRVLWLFPRAGCSDEGRGAVFSRSRADRPPDDLGGATTGQRTSLPGQLVVRLRVGQRLEVEAWFVERIGAEFEPLAREVRDA